MTLSQTLANLKLDTPEESKIKHYPLYDNINKSITPDFKFDSVEICGIISRLKEENQEHICALIHHHRLLTNANKIKKNGLIYGGKIMNENKTGCLWVFGDLPEDLQKILAKFALALK